MSRCAGYIRVSRIRSDDAVSPENQKEKILLQAKLLGIQEVDFYIDLDCSGKNTDRPEFQKMMSALNNYSHVIVYKLSRFSRSTMDFHSNIMLLEKAGVSLVSVSENIDTSTPVGRLIRNVLVDFAQFEREVIAEQVRDNMHVNAENGNWNGGNVPYGFDWIDKQLVANDKMEYVRYIFETIAAGTGANTICNYFFQRGIKSPSGQAKWHKNTVRNIVRNPIYCGKLKYGGKTSEGKHEQYISTELWEQANRELEIKGKLAPRTHGSQHLLSSLIKCPQCGRNLNIRYNGKNHKPVRRYVCPGRNDYVGHKCNCPLIDADSLETAVITELLKIASCPDILDEAIRLHMDSINIIDYAFRKRELQKELKKVKSDMSEMFKAYRAKAITLEQLKEENAGLLEQENKINQELENIEIQERGRHTMQDDMDKLKKYIGDLPQIWDALTLTDKREFINTIVQKIELTPDGVELDYQYFKLLIPYRLKTNTTIKF